MNMFATVAPFWILAIVIIAAVLAWVLPPLFRRPPDPHAMDRRDLNIAVYRDQHQELEEDFRNGLLSAAQRDAARAELEARLAQDALTGAASLPARDTGHRRLGGTLAVMIPAFALGVYLLVGEPGFMIQVAAAEQAEQERERKVQEALARLEGQVEQALSTLEEDVRRNPDDGVSWTFLANAYIARDQWEDAESAYARAYELLPETAVVVSGYAETLAVNAGLDLDGRPIALVREALKLDPDDHKGLELAGIHAYQNREFTTAAYYWNQLLRQMPEETPAHAELTSMVRNARILGHTEAFGTPEAGPADIVTVSGRVELAPELLGEAEPGDVVYLFARTASGAGQPLAALRTRLDQLPVTFTLDDSLALNPEHVLSNHESITLVARVSRHGDANARPGDLEGILEGVDVGRGDVLLTIDTVRP